MRRSNYRVFAEDYDCPLESDGGVAVNRTATIAPDRFLRFVGLNSALLCTVHDRDEGRLLIGGRQHVLPRTQGEELVVLCHHNPGERRGPVETEDRGCRRRWSSGRGEADPHLVRQGTGRSGVRCSIGYPGPLREVGVTNVIEGGPMLFVHGAAPYHARGAIGGRHRLQRRRGATKTNVTAIVEQRGLGNVSEPLNRDVA